MTLWLQLAVTVIVGLASGAVGAFIGSWRTAYRIGRWQEKTEMRIGAVEQRLQKGDRPVGQVPVLEARFDALKESVDGIAATLREELPRLVNREECDRRHEHNA